MLTGIALFLLTLCLGLKAVRLANYVTGPFLVLTDIEVLYLDDGRNLADFPRGVRITYNGSFHPSTEQHSPELRFLIFNGTAKDLTCIGDSGKCVAPEVRLRGLDASSWDCMNGFPTYTIKSGEAAELVVTADDFNLLPGRSEQVLVGYTFYRPYNESDQYFAEPIVLPAEFRKAISKHLKKYATLRRNLIDMQRVSGKISIGIRSTLA